MDLKHALHKKINQIPMAVVQRLISSMILNALWVLGELTEVIPEILSNDVTFEARPLFNLTQCTAL